MEASAPTPLVLRAGCVWLRLVLCFATPKHHRIEVPADAGEQPVFAATAVVGVLAPTSAICRDVSAACGGKSTPICCVIYP